LGPYNFMVAFSFLSLVFTHMSPFVAATRTMFGLYRESMIPGGYWYREMDQGGGKYLIEHPWPEYPAIHEGFKIAVNQGVQYLLTSVAVNHPSTKVIAPEPTLNLKVPGWEWTLKVPLGTFPATLVGLVLIHLEPGQDGFRRPHSDSNQTDSPRRRRCSR
jgi:hypothetical protein